MAPGDDKQPRKRDGLITGFKKVTQALTNRDRSRARNDFNSLSHQTSAPKPQLNADCPAVGLHTAIHKQALDKFKESKPKKAEMLWRYIKEFRDSADWHNELIEFMKAEREAADGKKLMIQLDSDGGNESLKVSVLFEKSIGWIEKMVEVGDVAVQYDPAHAALPWAAFRFILKSAVNYTRTKKTVWAGIETICKEIAWINVQEKLYLIGSHKAQQDFRESCLNFYLEIFNVLADFIEYYEDKTINRVVRSPFVSDARYHECIQRILSTKSEIQQFSQQIAREDQISQGNDSQKTLEILSRFDASINTVIWAQKEAFRFLEESERCQILNWVSRIPYSTHFSFAHEKALPDTGEWLFEEEEYKIWWDSTISKALRLHGGPGTGKSTLLSILINRLQSNSEKLHDRSLWPVWFYCNRSSSEPERRDYRSILYCLLRQLATSPDQKELHSAFIQRYHERDQKGLPQIDEVINLCVALIDDRGPTFILVDALDECETLDRNKVLSSLATLLKRSSQPLKVFITSRHGYDESVFNDLPEVKVNASCNSRDISRYITHKVDQMFEDKQILGGVVSSCLREDIIKQLNERADGMFKWVELQLERIVRSKREDTIRDLLLTLPTDLGQSYKMLFDHETGAMGSDDPTQLQITLLTFKLLLVANRQLHYHELCHLVGHFDASGNPSNKKLLLNSCFSLIEYDESGDILRFCHLSVREFFESSAFLVDHDDFNTKAIHACVLARCLQSMDSTHLGYHREQWPFHAMKAADERQIEPLKGQLRKFLSSSDDFRASYSQNTEELAGKWEWSSELPDRHSRNSPSPKALMVVCEFNLHELLQPLTSIFRVEELEMIRRQKFPRKTQGLMDVAAKNGHFQIVKVLVELGMKTEGCGCIFKGSPLYRTAKAGQLAILRFLIENNADVNAVGIDFGTALGAAASKGHLEVVEVLLHSGTDVNVIRGGFGTALGAAACSGRLDIVKLLLDRGADINAIGGHFGTALGAAAYSGRLDIVKLLLGRGADINAIGGHFGTALGAAARSGRLDIVELLLGRGADINAIGGHYGTALGVAAYFGRLDIVKLLLDRGADINVVGGNYGTALGAAVWSGEFDLIKLLLDRGADINVVGGHYGTALGAAVWSGEFDLIKLLLDRGADINVVGGNYGTALGAAARSGRLDTVELLLDHGADINAIGGRYGTALGAAARSGSLDIVKLLLNHGADINAIGGRYGTALGAAARSGRLDIVELLLDRGADINAIGGDYGTALGSAAWSGKLDIVELLLDRGADVNIKSKNGTTLDIFRRELRKTSYFFLSDSLLEELLDLLLNHKAKHSPNFLRGEGWLPDKSAREKLVSSKIISGDSCGLLSHD